MILRKRSSKLFSFVTLFVFMSALFLPILLVTDASASQTVEVVTIAKGTKYATPAYIIKSDKPGPVVAVTGGVHGDEGAGFRAAHQVKNYKISKGTLIVVPETNVIAVELKRRAPAATGDLNRLFPQNGGQPNGPLATAVVNFFKNYKVTWAMDLHEGFDFYKNPATNSVGQTIIYYPRGNSATFSAGLAKELNKDISKRLEQFSVLRWPVNGSLARYLGDQGAQSFIFETSKKQTLSVRIGQQLTAVNYMLNHLGMLADQSVPAPAPAPAPAPSPTPAPAPAPAPSPTPTPAPAPTSPSPEPTPTKRTFTMAELLSMLRVR